MNSKMVAIDSIKLNPKNPRKISNKKLSELVKSIKEFPEMLKIRPLVVDKDMVVLGGNMRLKALKRLEYKKVPIVMVDDLTEEQKKEFIIKDNVSFGEWDWDIMVDDWAVPDLENWGLNIPTSKNTELLSDLKYEPLYYEPKNLPQISLKDCVDMSKFEEKVKALDEYKLTKEQKEVLKLFAYRFIKIDFEFVANYYAFNASEEEQKAIERLRLVLTDDGIKGFIEDDLLRVLGELDINETDEQND